MTNFRTPVLLAATLVAAAACVPADTTAGSAAGDGAGFNVNGSSTVEPITALAAEFFLEDGGVGVNVGGEGTGNGFSKYFCSGETPITGASRQIKDSEREQCLADADLSESDIIELRIAIDGLTVATSPDASVGIDCLGFGDLYALLGPESTGFDTWADASALQAEIAEADGALTSGAAFPDAPLQLAGPGTESGTYDTFLELVLDDIAQSRNASRDGAAAIREDWQGDANDVQIVSTLTDGTTSLGWIGYAYYGNDPDALTAFSITDPATGDCVAPTPDAIASGAYPLARDLFLYVSAPAATDNPAVADYVDYLLSDTGQEAVVESGYVQLDAEGLAATRTVWSEAIEDAR